MDVIKSSIKLIIVSFFTICQEENYELEIENVRLKGELNIPTEPARKENETVGPSFFQRIKHSFG